MASQTTIISPKGLVERHPDLFTIPTLQRWRSVGIGPPYVVVGPRRIAYRTEDVERWIASRVASSTADARQRGLAA